MTLGVWGVHYPLFFAQKSCKDETPLDQQGTFQAFRIRYRCKMSCRCIISLAGANKTFQKLISLLFGYFVHGSHEWSRLLGYLEVRANAPIKVRGGVIRSTWTHLDPGKWAPHGAIRRGSVLHEIHVGSVFSAQFLGSAQELMNIQHELPPFMRDRLPGVPGICRSGGSFMEHMEPWCQLSVVKVASVPCGCLWLMDAYDIHLANDHRFIDITILGSFQPTKNPPRTNLEWFTHIYIYIYIYILYY